MARRDFGSVHQLRSGRWHARFTHPNTGRRHTASFTTKADASRWLSLQEADIAKGIWRDPALGRITFARWVESYLENAHHLRATTRSTVESITRNHLLPAFGKSRLAGISQGQVKMWVAGMVADDLAASTIRTRYALLRTIMNAAVAHDLIAVSPCRSIKLPAEKRDDLWVLTPEQLTALADATDRLYRPMIYLGGVLGLRWSEVAGLRVKRVNLLGGSLTVAETAPQVGGFGDTKTTASRRTLPLPSFLTELLAQHLAYRGLTAADGDELLFVGSRDGNRLHESNWHKRHWQPALAAASLEGFRFHWLRHTAVALMVEQKAHPKVIQERLGHASWATTMDVYGHLLDRADDGVTDALDALFRTNNAAEGKGNVLRRDQG